MSTVALDRRTPVLPAADVTEPVNLKTEREKRRMTREELADLAGVKLNWIRHIENGSPPSAATKDAIRRALERCPVHKALGVACNHKLPVPSDDYLYSPIAEGE